MPGPWYDVVDGGGLEQGDILLAYPIFQIERRVEEGETDVEVVEKLLDVVVLTQSCDIENSKVEELLLASVVSYASMREDPGADNFMKSRDFRKQAVQGALPAQSLLPENPDTPKLPWSLVDFHHLASTPRKFAEDFVRDAGPRLRLVAPYKEHLAQSFARYIMRVGLPTTLHDFLRA